MALHTLGTAAATSLVSLDAWSAVLSDSDVGSVNMMISSDREFAAAATAPGQAFTAGGPTAIFGTGTTHSNTTLDTLVAGSGSAPLTQLKAGMKVLGPAFPAGTFIASVTSGTAVVLSAAATTGAGSQVVAFLPINFDNATGGSIDRYANLVVPSRGTLKVFPGDYVAYDPITGWPILVSGAAVAQSGSLWTFT